MGQAQEPDWHWAHGFARGFPTNVLANEAGDVFIQLRFNDSLEVAGETFHEVNGGGWLLAKFNWAGTYQWVHQLPFDPGALQLDGAESFRFRRLGLDSIVLADTVVHAANTWLLVEGSMDPFGSTSSIDVVAQVTYNAYGNWIYFSQRYDGNIDAVATFKDSLRLAATTFYADSSSLLLAELSAEGDLLWSEIIGSGDSLSAGGVAEDLNGALYLTGTCMECVILDSTLTGYEPWGVSFQLSLDSIGQLRWMRAYQGMEGAGSFLGGGADRVLIGNVDPNNNSAEAISYVTCLDTAGTFLWAHTIAGPSWVGWPSIKRDQERHILAGSYYVGVNPDYVFHCLDSTGTLLWSKYLNEGGNLWGAAIIPSGYGEYYVIGSYELGVTLGPFDIYEHGSDLQGRFLAKLSHQPVSVASRPMPSTGILVYPAPASDMITVIMPEADHSVVGLYDAVGARLREFPLTNGYAQVGLVGLPPGAYCLRAGHVAARFIKE